MYKTLQAIKGGVCLSLCAVALLIASCATGQGKPEAASKPPPPENILSNGDFEGGDAIGWTIEVSSGEAFGSWEVKSDSWDSNNSSSILLLSNYGSGADPLAVSATQTLNLPAGSYAASIDVAGANEGSSKSELAFFAAADGAELASTSVALTGWSKWKTYEISFDLEAEADVTLGITGALAEKSYCDLDNVMLYLTK